MKTYMFEGKEYVESGDCPRLPKEGEVYYWKEGNQISRANFDFREDKQIILIPKEKKKMNTYSEKEMIALDGSIEKWDKIYKGELIDEGGDNCPLCLYSREQAKKNGDYFNVCSFCSIYKETLKDECRGISFWKWKSHVKKEHLNFIDPFQSREYKVYCSECKKIAEEIRDELKKIKDNIMKRERKKYYIRVENPDTAIGEEDIQIIVIDKDNNKADCGNVLWITKEGKVGLNVEINENLGLEADSGNYNRIKIIR